VSTVVCWTRSRRFREGISRDEIDCQSLAIEHVPMIGEITVVVCDSGVKHALVGGEYNALRSTAKPQPGRSA